MTPGSPDVGTCGSSLASAVTGSELATVDLRCVIVSCYSAVELIKEVIRIRNADWIHFAADC